jgi:metal-responsive CopG/Arc/MetJ family transcriptional regulator
MKTIQLTIDEPLLTAVDKQISDLNTTRSAFIREALLKALQGYKIAQLEQKHAEGYLRHPVEPGEFDTWETEQAWGES